jgi:hypothetical protein
MLPKIAALANELSRIPLVIFHHKQAKCCKLAQTRETAG